MSDIIPPSADIVLERPATICKGMLHPPAERSSPSMAAHPTWQRSGRRKAGSKEGRDGVHRRADVREGAAGGGVWGQCGGCV
eukprot:24719-Eustigmatos_ZCMA.PRE.1